MTNDWKIVTSDQGIIGLSHQKNANGHDLSLTCDSPITDQARQELNEFFSGKRKSFTIPLDLEGTEFQMQVWKALLTIPYGQTVSYLEVAQRIGNPKAVRAVGTAIGKNPTLLFIPCHRVIASDGSIGGYSAGIEIKKQLLELESRLHNN